MLARFGQGQVQAEKLSEIGMESALGLLLVILLHIGLLYAAMSYKLVPAPQEAVTLFVNLINPPPQKKEELPLQPLLKPPPKKVKLDKPPPIRAPKPLPLLAAEASQDSNADVVVPPPPVQVKHVNEVPAVSDEVEDIEAPPPQPVGLVEMRAELSLACPNRTTPNYPVASRRMGEHGRVVLRAELDEAGKITSVVVKESSGYRRLDEAGLQAVKSWACHPAIRGGVPVRAVALQPFDFILD